jgi:hypothetical protein
MKLQVHLTAQQAADLALFLKRLTFEDFLAKTEPHKGKAVCTEDAYRFRDAIGIIEDALEVERGFRPR